MTIVVCSSLYASEVASHAMSRGKMDMVFESVKFLDGKYDPRPPAWVEILHLNPLAGLEFDR